MITSMIISINYLLIIISQPIFLTIISLCSRHLDISLSALPLPISLSSLSWERAGRDQAGEREFTRAWRRRRREPPLRDDASKNHHDGEPPEVGLILLSSSRHRRQGCRDGGKVAERIFLTLHRANLRGFIKSRLAPNVSYGALR